VKTLKGRIAILIGLVVLGSSVPSAFSTDDTFRVDYTFELAAEDCGAFLVKDTQVQEIPGEPVIPYRTAQILLPQDAVVKDIKVKGDTPLVQTGLDLPWGQPPCTFSDDPVTVDRNEEIYNSMDKYPEEIYRIVSVESFRGFQILNMVLYPIQYQPKSKTVTFYPTVTVTVQCGTGMKNKLYRGLTGDKKDVAGMVDNPELVQTYEDGPSTLQTEEYIIITNTMLQSTFQTLANWKANYVNGTGVYTINWIMCHCDGVDTQEKIRNFIKDMYTNRGTKYVLLGGDVAVVPYRGFYISSGGYTDYDMAADMYYAHLDGTFNDDGDSYWAETTDGVDWTADVAVGRAPVENTTEAQAFVNKVIAYEQMAKPERICLHQSRVQSGNSPDSRCLAYNCDDWIPGGYTIDYLFEEDSTVTKTAWRTAWAANPIAVVHIGLGNTTVYHINYEVGGTVSWYTSDVSSLTNTFFPWTTSTACICGAFTANDCLAEAYVKDDCGAIGAIYNDNYGWLSTLNACQYSGEFCEMEVRACWSDGYEKLGEMLNRSRYYLASSAQSNSYYRWCFYERNLIGDPETPCLTQRGGQLSLSPSPLPSTEEYIIITDSTLQSTFEKLACWKANFVDGVGVYTVSWIHDNYTGTDDPERIRNFIKDMYTNHSTKYVLLGGDVNMVPHREFYMSDGVYTDADIPADMYYAHLDGTFNDDSDSRWAEPNDGIDWTAEVAVGRAPVQTGAEAEAFVNKVITYEQADKPKRVVLHQARLASGNIPDSRCLAWNCDDWIPGGYTIDYLFEEDGTVTKTAWRAAWAANPLIVVQMGEGTTSSHYINYEVGGTETWYTADVPTLTNTFFPVFISAADFCGDFKTDDCLAEEYVKKCKAIAAIANASYMWYSAGNACTYSGEFVESFFRALFSDGKEHLGDMLNKGKNYMVSSAQSNTHYRWCFYSFNLIGDPETPVLTKRKSVSITNPIDGTYVYKNSSVTITTTATEWVNTVKFFLIYVNDSNQVVGELLCTDTTSPFQCSWNPATYPVGKWYTIRAEGYHCGQVKDIDEITVQLLSPSSTLHLRSVGHKGGEGLGTSLLPVFILIGSAASIAKRR
jgi:hypothetical protein